MKKKKSITLKKPINNIPSPINSSRSKNSNINEAENEEIKKKPEESYSSFLIRMLEEDNKKYKKKAQNGLSTIYNNNLLNKKSNYNPFNTNYTSDIKVGLSMDAKKLNTNINFEYSKENKNINNFISYTDRNGLKQKKDSIKLIKQFNTTQLNTKNKTKFKSFELNDIDTNLINTRNNTNWNQNILTNSELLKQLKRNKKIKIVRSVNNLNRMRLNALYGYDKNFVQSKKNLLKKKDLVGLENYQNDILKVSQRNLSKDNMYKLFTELESIKKNAEMVKPLPPINYPALIIHSFKEVEDKRRNKSKIPLEDKKLKDMDEYEKELFHIKKGNSFKRVKIERNKRLYKIYEILPEHVVNTLYRNKNKFIY